MNKIIRDYLCDRNILVKVSDEETLPLDNLKYQAMLSNSFAIRLNNGIGLIDNEIIDYLKVKLCISVPLPFYKGFPESVKNLSDDQILFDRLVNYYMNYNGGKEDFPFYDGHSIFESEYKRAIFNENVKYRIYDVVSVDEANEKVKEIVTNFLSDTRELNEYNYRFCLAAIEEKLVDVKTFSNVKSISNAIKFLVDLNEIKFIVNLHLSNVPKIFDYMMEKRKEEERPFINDDKFIGFADYYERLEKYETKHFALKNKQRIFVKNCIDYLVKSKADFVYCYPKRKEWVYLLHHIHYKTENKKMQEFINAIRNNINNSVESGFESLMNKKEYIKAAELLIKEKGQGMFLRNIQYILTRTTKEEDVKKVISLIDTDNNIILLSLLKLFGQDKELDRIFVFYNEKKMKSFREDKSLRKYFLSKRKIQLLKAKINEQLKKNLQNKLENVYISKKMSKVIINPSDTALIGGQGILPTGSRLKIDVNKILRFFVYWEKVNDIDLSMVGLDKDGNVIKEYAYYSMHSIKEKEYMTFSGDCTDGYNGGSEYYDVNLPLFIQKNPKVKYLICSINVYSGINFSKAKVKAGYMVRSKVDSGEIYEPKTVRNSFDINCESTEAITYGIDLEKKELVWLNLGIDSLSINARSNSYDYPFMVMNNNYKFTAKKLLSLSAKNVVSKVEEADIVVSDARLKLKDNQKQVHSYDYDFFRKLLS